MKSGFETTIMQGDDAANDSAPAAQWARFCAVVRQLEPFVAGAIAALIAWLAATSDTGAPVLWAVALLALAVGLAAMARRTGPRLDSARTDSSNALYNRRGLLTHGENLLARCRRERRDLTLVVFDCNDLLEASTIYGQNTSRALIASIVRKLTLLAGDQGLAARTGPTQFAVAMPMSRDRAAYAIERVLGNPCRIELERRNSEIVLVPNLMIEAVSRTETFERLFAAMCRGLARVQEEEETRLRYLQRERERHSRHRAARNPSVDGLAPVGDRADHGTVHGGAITMPMPLPMR